MKQTKRIRQLTGGATVAALYVVLTLLSETLGLASGFPQCRLSEMLCVLPLFMPSAVPGVTVGCLLANLLLFTTPLDVIFGTLATGIGAVLCRLIGRHFQNKPFHVGIGILASLPNVIANTCIIPFVLRYALHIETALPVLLLEMAIGECLSTTVLGTLLLLSLPNRWKNTRNV